jgi:hypothetical protein
MFGNLQGTVQNVGLLGGSVRGSSPVGGLVGTNSGLVQNCYTTGNVSGTSRVGGVVGQGYNRTQNCYATGIVSTSGGGNNYTGGVVGSSEGGAGVFNCVALNSRVTTTENNASNVSRVAHRYAGVTNVYARADMVVQYGAGIDKPITENLNDGDGLSITAAEYNNETWWTDPANWNTTQGSAWDFDTVWQWDSARNLPALRNVGE